MSRTWAFLFALVLGPTVILTTWPTEWFYRSGPFVFALLPVGPVLMIFGLYGLLSKRLFARGEVNAGAQGAAKAGMRMATIPFVVKLVFFGVLLPLFLPIVRRAHTHAGVAARVVGFWIAVLSGFAVIGLCLRLAFHHAPLG